MEPKGEAPGFGLIRVGMRADMVSAPENPLANIKTLNGTGTERLNDATNQQERIGGIRWTIRNGIVFDAPALLASVGRDVEAAKAAVAGPSSSS